MSCLLDVKNWASWYWHSIVPPHQSPIFSKYELLIELLYTVDALYTSTIVSTAEINAVENIINTMLDSSHFFA